MRKDEIVELDVNALIPYARNNKIHNRKQLDKLKAVIKEHGYDVYIVVDEDNVILKGHGRHEVITELGWDKVKCIKRYGLTKTEKKAIRIEDNKIAELAEWDNDMLALELKDLADVDFDIETLGFDIEEVKALDNLLDGDLEDNEIIEDEVPEVEENPYSKMGDLWLLGSHRLLCGDSTDEVTVARLMNGKKADMVFTDPPYGVEYQSNMRTKSKKFDVLKNDDKELDIIPVIKEFSKGWVFIWTTWKVLDKWLEKTKDLGFPSNMVVWFKGGGGIGDLKKTFSTDYEVSLVWHRGAELTGKRIGSVWSYNKDSASSYLHPTQKPVTLSAEAMDKTTNKKDKVLDLFGGSGSTLIAAEQTNRNCFMMELDEKYIDVIVKRYHNLGKGDITLIRDGKEYKWEEIKSEVIK